MVLQLAPSSAARGALPLPPLGPAAGKAHSERATAAARSPACRTGSSGIGRWLQGSPAADACT
eukprot:1264353-Lingulodinium_polyedra.AAC.1